MLCLSHQASQALRAQNFVWAKRAGDAGLDIATDGVGNSYVTGNFIGSATFGSGGTNETNLTSAFSTDIFVAKYDASGNLVWAKRAGGRDLELSHGIAVDSSGNSYVTGEFERLTTFGPGEGGETTLTAAGFGRDIFVAKYGASGDLLWAKRAGGISSAAGLSIAVDGAGESYVTGSFSNPVTFGEGETAETVLGSAGSVDIFVAKYSANGELVWAKRAGSDSFDRSNGIATDGAGNSYVTGFFRDSFTFGPGEAGETVLESAGSADIFVAKYGASGDLVWAKRAGGTGGDEGLGISADGAGNSYSTGSFDNAATFGPGEAGETTLESAGSADMFVAKYDASGDLLWGKRSGGIGAEQGAAIAVDGEGNTYVTGSFSGSIAFGPGESTETVLTGAGSFDIFLAKYDLLGDLVWARRAGGTANDQGLGIGADNSGTSYVTGFFNSSAIFGPGESNETILTSMGLSDMFVAKYSPSPPPVADAGLDQTLECVDPAGTRVNLNGLGSSDPLTYTWNGPFSEGDGSVIGDMVAVTLPVGMHTIMLTVNDGNGGSGSDEVVVTVEDTTPPNLILASTSFTVTIPSAESSVAVAVLLESGASATDICDDNVDITFMPAGPYGLGATEVTITATDAAGLLAQETLSLNVNRAPVADAGPDQNATVGGPGGVDVTLNGTGSSDPDGDPLTYTWTGPFGTSSDVSPTVQIPGGVHPVALRVDDGRGGMDTDMTTITVRTIMVSPSSLTFTVEKGAQSNSQSFTVQALGGTLSYSMVPTVAWLDSNPSSGRSSGEKDTIQAIVDPGNLSPGTYTGRLVVNGPGVIKESVRVTLIVSGDGGGGGGGTPTPKPFENGVVDTADFTPFGEPGHAVALQSVVSIFGEDFVAAGEFRAESVPLPTMLGGVMVTFDGIKVPLFLVSPGLIIAQLPAGVTLPTATMVITNGGAKAASAPLEIQVAEYSPGVFTLTQDGEDQGIVVHAGTVDLAAPVGTVGDSRPAGEGDHLTIYANGLGPVNPAIADGANSCDPDGVCLPDGSNVVLRHTLTTPVIRIGGVAVPAENVLFSGSSPASVGVNEIVFTMPGEVPAGDAVSLTVEIGGVVSREVTMAVE